MSITKRMYEKKQNQSYESNDTFVCADCIGNSHLASFINSNKSHFSCSYCGKKGSELAIAVEFDTLMDEIMNGIKTEWEHPEESVGYSRADGGWQGAKVYTGPELFQERLAEEAPDINESLYNDIINSQIDYQWCKHDPYALAEHDYCFATWQSFSNIVKYEKRYFFQKNTVEVFSDGMGNPFDILKYIEENTREFILLTRMESRSVVYRARKNIIGETFNTYKQLGCPLKENATQHNRMSPAGIVMFYGALDENTALAEVGHSSLGVTVAGFELLQSLYLIDLCEIHKIMVPSLFDSEKRKYRGAVTFMKMFLGDFMKPITDDTRKHIEYIPTQVVTEYFRDNYKSQHNIDGIIYPSAVHQGGKNVVLFIDQDDITETGLSAEAKKLRLDTSKIKIFDSGDNNEN